MTDPCTQAARTSAGENHETHLRVVKLDNEVDTDSGDAEVISGLRTKQKTLPSRFFYDDHGSQLYKRICETPEYYPWRTERDLLIDCVGDIAELAGPSDLVELGSGSAVKTKLLLMAFLSRQGRVRYIPIDVNDSILEESAKALLEAYSGLDIRALVGTYEQGLAALERLEETQRKGENEDGPRHRLALFLGSTLGNFTPAMVDRLHAGLHDALGPGDHFLIGTDLHKDRALIEAAYNDREGVTAAFNLNMLDHLNARYDGDFDTTRFAHWAFYNAEMRRIEMHLRSLAGQKVRLEKLGLTISLGQGETIRTEISRKFTLGDVAQSLAKRGFTVVQAWTDPRRWYGITLAKVI